MDISGVADGEHTNTSGRAMHIDTAATPVVYDSIPAALNTPVQHAPIFCICMQALFHEKTRWLSRCNERAA